MKVVFAKRVVATDDPTVTFDNLIYSWIESQDGDTFKMAKPMGGNEVSTSDFKFEIGREIALEIPIRHQAMACIVHRNKIIDMYENNNEMVVVI